MHSRTFSHRLVPWGVLVSSVQSGPAQAQPAALQDVASVHPVELSLATGVLFPFGEEHPGSSLRDQVGPAFPIELGVGARLFRVLSVGIAGAWGIALDGASPPTNTVCGLALNEGGGACSITLMRIGGMLALHPFPAGRWDPWFSAGVSYEALLFHSSLPMTVSTDPSSPPERPLAESFYATRGWLGQSRLGMDYAFASTLRAGAYLSCDFGRYYESDLDEYRSDLRVPAGDVTFENKAWHVWLGGGVRLVFLGP